MPRIVTVRCTDVSSYKYNDFPRHIINWSDRSVMLQYPDNEMCFLINPKLQKFHDNAEHTIKEHGTFQCFELTVQGDNPTVRLLNNLTVDHIPISQWLAENFNTADNAYDQDGVDFIAGLIQGFREQQTPSIGFKFEILIRKSLSNAQSVDSEGSLCGAVSSYVTCLIPSFMSSRKQQAKINQEEYMPIEAEKTDPSKRFTCC